MDAEARAVRAEADADAAEARLAAAAKSLEEKAAAAEAARAAAAVEQESVASGSAQLLALGQKVRPAVVQCPFICSVAHGNEGLPEQHLLRLWCGKLSVPLESTVAATMLPKRSADPESAPPADSDAIRSSSCY